MSDDALMTSPARRWRLSFGRSYSLVELQRDLLAAMTVAAISLPQAMAYALLAGVDPRYGLYSAIVVTAVAAVFGSSSHLINGPTSAISLVVFAALSVFDPEQRIEAAEGMFLLGAMVGSLQIAIGVFRLGDLTRYISESVILGFMSAAAALLAIGQIGNALGLRESGTGAQHVLERLWLTLRGGAPNGKAIVITLATLLLAWLARRLVNRYRLPRMDMLAVFIVVAVCAYIAGWTVPTASGQTAVAVAGTVPAVLPSVHIPIVKPGVIGQLTPDALAIAFLGLLEALAIAKSIATHTGQALDFNRQCLAEGLANLAGAFFRCLPGSGSLSRSALNYQSGGATRFVGILTAAAVALAVLVLAPLAHFVPKAALAALLLITAKRLIDPKRLLYTVRASRQDCAVLVITVAAALAFGLDIAILAGVALSIVLYVSRATRLKIAELIVNADGGVRERLPVDAPAADFAIFDLEGELFFGAAPHLERCLAAIMMRVDSETLRYVVLRLKRVRNPDAMCLEQLEHFLRACTARDVSVLLAGIQPDLFAAVRRLGFFDWFPETRAYIQGRDEDSATLAAIRAVHRGLHAPRDTANTAVRQTDSDTERPLYYLL